MLHEVIQQQHLDLMSKPSKRDQKNKVKEKAKAIALCQSEQGLNNGAGGKRPANGMPKSRFGSFVVGTKLRESKWFAQEEISIFCAVVETGFLVERQLNSNNNNLLQQRQRQQQKSVNEDEGFFQDDFEDGRNGDDSNNVPAVPSSEWGVVVWKLGFEKSKNPDYMTIYTVKQKSNKLKVVAETLKDFWPPGTKIRINNQADQHKSVNIEEDIRQQVQISQKKKEKWHNSEHYAFWCRYEKPDKVSKLKLFNDSMKWGSVGLNAGLLMFNRRHRFNTDTH